MNAIRSHWKDNGTPFYFCFKFEDIRIFIPEDVCKKLDTIMFDNLRQHTCMDILVEIREIRCACQRLSNPLVLDFVMYELFQCVLMVLRKAKLVEVNSYDHIFDFEK